MILVSLLFHLLPENEKWGRSIFIYIYKYIFNVNEINFSALLVAKMKEKIERKITTKIHVSQRRYRIAWHCLFVVMSDDDDSDSDFLFIVVILASGLIA